MFTRTLFTSPSAGDFPPSNSFYTNNLKKRITFWSPVSLSLVLLCHTIWGFLKSVRAQPSATDAWVRPWIRIHGWIVWRPEDHGVGLNKRQMFLFLLGFFVCSTKYWVRRIDWISEPQKISETWVGGRLRVKF